jgi:hypothetical protein
MHVSLVERQRASRDAHISATVHRIFTKNVLLAIEVVAAATLI